MDMQLAGIQIHVRNAKNELVMAVLGLEQTEHDFTKTTAEMKQTIGDLVLAERLLDDWISGKEAQRLLITSPPTNMETGKESGRVAHRSLLPC